MSKNYGLYVCQICGAQVSKRKSFSYKEGRACKHHEEVRELVEFQQEIERAQRLSRSSKKGGTIHDRLKKVKEVSEWGKSHCWICRCEGIESSKYWKIVLDVFGTGVAETLEDLFKQDEMDGKKILIQFPLAGTKMFKKIDKKVSKEASLTGYVVACPDCAREFKQDPEFLISASANVDPEYLGQFNINDVEQIEELI